MNRILVAANAVLIVAVGYLFYKVYSGDRQSDQESMPSSEKKAEEPAAKKIVQQSSSVPNGKIAYVNIDRLNEESLEIADLVSESKRRKESIEGSMESLNLKYQNKVEEFQLLQKGGIAPKAELESKAREIQNIEQEAQNKQLQMDQLSLEMNRKNEVFQRSVREVLQKWNNGKYDYILSYSEAVPTLLLGNSSLEITEEIIKEVNQEYKQRKSGKKK